MRNTRRQILKLASAGAGKILFSADHPWVGKQIIIDQIASQKFLSGDVERIYSRNAKALFQL